MATVDTSRWTRVGGTAAGGYFEIEPDVLVAVPHEGYEHESNSARRSLDELYRLVRDRGRKVVLIVLVDAVSSQDADARRVWAGVDPALCAGYALVCSTMLAQAIGAFFVGLNRPRLPLGMFETLDEARAWARGTCEEQGGPIGG